MLRWKRRRRVRIRMLFLGHHFDMVLDGSDLVGHARTGSEAKAEVLGRQSRLVESRQNIDRMVKKFSEDFQLLLFHYDGRTSEWDEFEWSKSAIHGFDVRNLQFKLSFSHMIGGDLGVEHFNGRIKKHGLEISQPGLEPNNGLTWQMTQWRGDREVHKFTEEKPGCCSDPHVPPCAADPAEIPQRGNYGAEYRGLRGKVIDPLPRDPVESLGRGKVMK
ncbi:hypothetical protein Pint_23111 [Pistacia integerrima]|uniref:Uncharacterized protein n=1 Tax=Pistacia integerrima TaxID=434235 RepID=A0ACC0YI84_9ROSI|nr:hypothetical protein Pint_23111 [Pistacia integerrima]